MALPISGSMKSCTLVRVGLPLGWYSWPALEYSPISSFFFRVDGDHRLAVGHEGRRSVVDVVELGVAVHVLGALFLLGRPLKAIAHLVEELSDCGGSDVESLGPQGVGQFVGRLGCP